MSVIDRIMALLAERRISARKLTMDVGIANSSISEWKKGKAKPSIEAIVRIANYFGVTTDYLLLGGKERQNSENEKANCSTENAADSASFGKGLEESIRGSKSVLNTPDIPEDGEEPNRRNSLWDGEALEIGESDWERQGARLSIEDRKLLRYYHRLDAADREYILCKIIVLERECAEQAVK